MRLERWPRSLAIFSGCAAYVFLFRSAFRDADMTALAGRGLAAFLLTWGISTANYIVNEIVDLDFDIHHPSKRFRPLVRGEISKGPFALLGVALIATCLGLAPVLFTVSFLLSLTSLLAAGIVYNVKPVRTKDVPFLDSISESANNPIRFLIGWYVLAAQFPPLSLLLAWWAFGNFLMVGKRVAEKKFLTAEESSAYRLSLNRYSVHGLVAFMTVNGLLFLAMFILFAVRLSLKTFLYALPFIMFYLIFFMVKSIQDRDAAEEPEKLLKNPYFAIYTIFLLVIFIIAFWLR